MLAGPVADRGAAALEDHDVEGVDLGLEQYLRRVLGRARGGERELARRRCRLLHEPLQGPIPTANHLRRDAGERMIEPNSPSPPANANEVT